MHIYHSTIIQRLAQSPIIRCSINGLAAFADMQLDIIRDKRAAFLAGAFALLVAGFLAQGALRAAALLAALSVLFWLGLQTVVPRLFPEHARQLLRVLILLFELKLVILLAVHATVRFPDESAFDYYAWSKVQEWRGGDVAKFSDIGSGGVLLHMYMLSGIYQIFGHVPLIAKLLNVFLGFIAGILLFSAARGLFGGGPALGSLILYGLFPAVSFWSSTLLREASVLFTVSLAFAAFASLVRRFAIVPAFMLLLGWALTYTLRWYVGVILVAAMALGFVWSCVVKRRWILACASVLLGLIVIGSYFPHIESRVAPEAIQRQRSMLDFGRSAFLPGSNLSSYGKIAAFLPQGIAHFLFAPFPWDTNTRARLLELPDMLYWYALLFLGVLGIPVALKRPEGVGLILALVLLAAFHGIIEGNIGTLVRHRVLFNGLWTVLAGYAAARIALTSRDRPYVRL